MQPKLTKTGIINLSRRHISLPTINASEQKSADEIYELHKATLLNERPWGFCLKLTQDIQPTNEGVDLGYQFKYKLPPKTLGVVALNPSQRFTVGNVGARALLSVGYTPGDDLPVSNDISKERFYFEDNVLHCNADVKEALIKIDPEEKKFTVEFMMCLSWQLAKYWAISIRGNGQFAGFAQREANNYHARAYRALARQFPSVDEQRFYGWLRQYYGSLYS